MKKTLTILGILVALGLPFTSFAAVTYSRSPSGFSVASPVTFNVSFDDYSETACNYDYWGVQISDFNGIGWDPFYASNAIPSSTLSQSFTVILPTGLESGGVLFGCSDNLEITDPNYAGNDIEGDGSAIIFTIISPTAVAVPAGFVSGIQTVAGGQISDPGTLLVVVLVAGVPFAFYVIHKLIGLIPKSKKR